MKRSHFLYLLIAVIFFSSCNRNKIFIEYTNFSDEINLYQNLEFRFNKEIVHDSMLNVWDSAEYMEFKPEIKGKFRWEEPNLLVFSPENGFAPSTEYVAKPTKLVKKVSNLNKLKLTGEEFVFHTPYLSLSSSTAYWSKSQQTGKIEIRCNLKFNYAINALDLTERLSVSIDGKERKGEVLTSGHSSVIEIAIPDPEIKSEKAIPVKIEIEPGVRIEGTENSNEEKLEDFFEIPPQDNMQIMRINTTFEDGEGVISVLTTQPVDNEKLSPLVSVKPQPAYKISRLDNGFQLKGDFKEGKTYTITISGELRGIFGHKMGDTYRQDVNFGTLEPMVEFTEHNAIYLTSKGEKNLGINIVNVPDIKVSVFKIYENNIIHYLRTGKRYSWEYHDGEYYDAYTYPLDEDYGKEIFSKEISTGSLKKKGNLKYLNVNLEEIGYSDDLKGIYLVSVESISQKWLRDRILVSVSDIGLIAKKTKNDILVFANSIKEAKPISNVKINFISSNNQTVYTANTNGQGLASLENMEEKIEGFDISMITASDGDDFNFMLFNQSMVEISRFDVGGKRTLNSDYDVFVYGDRNLYRPGDSVFINSIVRTLKWEPVSELALKIKVILPTGREYLTFKEETNSQGAAEVAFHLPAENLTGMYSVNVYSGNDVLLESYRFNVEEFMPDRIRVISKLDKEIYKPNEKLEVDITATNLFGPPAANRNVEVEMSLDRSYFSPKNLDDYNFYISTDYIHFSNTVRESKTDDEGKNTSEFSMPSYKGIGVVDGTIYTTVFDETGRPVNRVNRFSLHTQDVFYGIKRMDYYVDTRRNQKIGFIAADKDGKVLNNQKAKVTITRYYYETIMEKKGSRFVYNSQRREQVVFSKEMNISGKSTYINYTPIYSGQYQIEIKEKSHRGSVKRTFYAYGWGDTDYSSFEVNREGEIEIELDKESYEVGDEAKVLFKSPFSGSILVTVEQNDILEYHYLSTDEKAASFKLPIRDEHLPNVYITATAIREMDDRNIPLTVAHGIINIPVENPDNKLEINITAVEKSRSKRKQKVQIKTDPNTELTIAVVDEGILQITNYKTPDPYEFFYSKRALEVNSYDLYSYLYPELRTSSTAGDYAMEMGKRNNPMTNKRIKLLALWSGQVKANSRGNAEFEFYLPQFSGAVRIMVVGYKDNKFGNADKEMKVADPVVISAALPRFISPGDKVKMPVFVTNTLEKSSAATVSYTLKGPLTSVGSKTEKLSLKANAENQAEFELAAQNDIGEAEIIVKVTAHGETFTHKTDISVRPAAGLQKITDNGNIKVGNSASFKVKTDFIPRTSSSKLVISKSPIAEFLDDLDYLVRYPYGCLEQTVSSAFPQIYLADFAKIMNKDEDNLKFDADYHVQQAVHKVQSMQMYDGSFSYWPGRSHRSPWSSIYATHFLIEARKAGFDVTENVLDNAIRYVDRIVRDRNETYYQYYDEYGNLKSKTIAGRETFYGLFVLSLYGEENKSTMNYYKSNQDDLTTDSKFLLAGAFALAGDQNSYYSIVPRAWSKEKSVRSFSGSFYSYVRDKSIALYAMVEVDPDNKMVGTLSKHLSEELKSKNWLSTQERAFAMIALGKIAHKAANTDVKADIYVDNKKVASFDNKDLVLTEDINSKDVKITTKGSGNLYYFYEVEGVSASGNVKEEDAYISVRKNFYDRYGHLLSGESFAQNDLIVVEIIAKSLENKTVENVAITDILPACFEIENPRLSPTRDMEWIRYQSSPDYLDIRDDRINLFTDLRYSEKKFYYMVRVVSKGEYQMGPVQADAMYNGEYHSYWGARKVVVQ
jgi:uncharacterized protein YfaS (alpha-2-macroglobulin family)